MARVRRGRLRAADCVREHRQPAAGARLRARTRARGAGRARRHARPRHPATAHRERAPGRHRRRRRGGVRCLGRRRARLARACRARRASNEVGLDATVFAFAALLTLATGVAFGLAPALQSSRTDVTHALKDAARGGSGVGGPRRSPHAGRRGDRARADAAHRRRLAAGDVRAPAVGRPGVQSRERPGRVRESSPRASYDTPAKLPRLLRPGARKSGGAAGRAEGGAGIGASAQRRQRHQLQHRRTSRAVIPVRDTRHLVPAGERRLLRRDGHDDAPRAGVCRRRAGPVGRRQRDVRADVLPARGAARPPRAVQRCSGGSLVHDHRRRGRREGPRRARGGEGGNLHSVLAAYRARHGRDSEEREPCASWRRR